MPKPCLAVVQVLPRGSKDRQWASKLVWWLASLANKQREHLEPEVGDTVVETTHRLGLAKHGLGLISAVGELIAIETNNETGTAYTIRTLEGKEQRWVNAKMEVLEKKCTL